MSSTLGHRLTFPQRVDQGLVKIVFGSVLLLGGIITTAMGFSTKFITPAMFVGPVMLAAVFVFCLVRCVQWKIGEEIPLQTRQFTGRAVGSDRTATRGRAGAASRPTTTTSRRPDMPAPDHTDPETQPRSYSTHPRLSMGNLPAEQVPYIPMGVPVAPPAIFTPVLPPYSPWSGDELPPPYEEVTKSHSKK